MSDTDWKTRAKVVADDPAPVAAGGDWKTRAKVVTPDAPPAPTEPGKLEAIARGGAQGATMGFADEAAGAGGYLGALWSKYGPEALGGAPAKYAKEIDPSTAYQQDRDLYRAKDKAAEDAHPVIYNGSEFVAGLAPAFVVPGGAVTQGALNSAGHSTAKTAGGVLADTATGAALGKIAEVGSNAIGSKLQSMAENRAIKAAGAKASDVSRLSEQGKLQDLGRFILDQKLLAGTPEGVAAKAAARNAKAGQQIGTVLGQLDQKAPMAIVPDAIADRVDQELVTPLRSQLATEPTEARLARLSEKLRAMRPGLERGEIGAQRPGYSFTQAEENLKRPLDTQINWRRAAPDKAEPLKQVRGIISDTIENEAQKADPKLAAQYLQAKKDFGLSREVQELAQDASERDLGNRLVSPSDHMAGMAGVLLHGAPGGVALGAANHLLRKSGSAFGAQAADLGGKLLQTRGADMLMRQLAAAHDFSRLRDMLRGGP